MVNYSDNADALKFNALKPSSDKPSPVIAKNISSEFLLVLPCTYLSHHREMVIIP